MSIDIGKSLGFIPPSAKVGMLAYSEIFLKPSHPKHFPFLCFDLSTGDTIIKSKFRLLAIETSSRLWQDADKKYLLSFILSTFSKFEEV